MVPAAALFVGAFLGALAGVFGSRALSAYLVAVAFRRARRAFVEPPTVTPAGNLHEALARVSEHGAPKL